MAGEVTTIESMAGATYDDLVRLPENMVGELIDGELCVSTRPPGPCLRIQSALGMLIGLRYHLGVDGPGGWWILREPELRLADDVLVPSVAGWRRERMPTVPEAFTVVPDWVCETRIDRRKMLPIYAQHGVRHVWIAEPAQKGVEVLKLVEGTWAPTGTYTADEVFTAEPFPLAEIDLPLIWKAIPDYDSQ